MMPMSSTALLRRHDRRRREGDAAGSDTGLERRPDGALDAAASRADLEAPSPQLLALQSMHDSLGNDFFASGPALDPTAALLQQHTMGSLALAMAGFEGADQLTPGSAPLSVMRQLMRRTNAEDEGLDTQTAAARIGSRAGTPLPDAVRTRMERAFGHDFGHVRVHTDGGAAHAADALHAMAFAIGRDIYFGRGAWRPGTPAGDELLAHELTHVVQADEGRLPSSSGDGMDVSSPTDRHEREAVDTARSVAALLGSGGAELAASDLDAPLSTGGMGVGPMNAGAMGAPAGEARSLDAPTTGAAPASAAISAQAQAGGGEAVAHREATTSSMSSTGASSVRGEAGEGETYTTLTIAGKPVEVRMPPAEDREAQTEVTLDERPVDGIHLTSAVLEMDANGVVVGGTVRGRLEVEGAFEGTQVSFGILPGGQIAPGVKGVPVKVGPASGTMDLEVTRDGIHGTGTLQAAELGLPSWVGIQGGAIEIAFGSGSFTGQGTVQGTQTERGQAVLAATLVDKQLTAQVTYTLTPGQQPVPGVTINSGVLTGTLVKQLGEGEAAGEADGAVVDSRPASTDVAPAETASGPSGAETTGSGAAPGVAPASGMGEGESAAFEAPAIDGSMPNIDGGAPASGAQVSQGGGEGGLTLNGTANVSVKDWVTGDVEMGLTPSTGMVDMKGTLAAAKEYTFGDITTTKAELSLDIQQNQAIEAKAVADFTAPRVIGKLTADYDFQNDLLDGQATARLSHNWPIEVAWGELRMLRGGRLDAIVRDNKLDEIKGRVRFDAEVPGLSETPLDVSGIIEGTFDVEEQKVNGTATGTLDSDYQLATREAPAEGGEGGAQALFLMAASTVRATLTDNNLQQVSMDAGLRYDRDGAPFMSGQAQGAVYDVEKGELSGEGVFTLLTDIERTTRGGQWGLKILTGSQLTATVDRNAVSELGGQLDVVISDTEGPLLNGSIDDAKITVGDWKVSGKIKLTTARKFFYPGEGQTLEGGYSLEILPGSGVRGVVADDELTDVGATLNTMVKDTEGSLARLKLEADWDLEKDLVDGKGTLSLARNITVAEGMTEESWDAELLRGTKAIGHIEDNVFTKITGEMKGRVNDAQGEFIAVTGEGEWTTADQMLDLTANVTVTREKELARTESGWQVALIEGGTDITATVADDVLQSIDGTMSTIVRRQGADFAQVALTGTWTEANGFTGNGGAELLTEIEVGTSGEYKLWVVKGTGASIGIESNEISTISGTVPVRLDEGDAAFMRGFIDGTYQIEEKSLSGTGKAEILVEKELGKLGDDSLWVIPSTNATATFENNALTGVGGEMNLSARDDGGEYGRIKLAGTFDAAGGTGFSGTGELELVREKQLYATEGYSFWLTPGAGSTAHILANKLVLIDGDVPFMVKDAQGELIKGSVNGVYDPATGLINGKGSVYLGRTLDYDLGGSTQLKLLKDSGGDADVVDSQLTRLGGSLTAQLWVDGEGIVEVTADGSYDVVKKELTRLSGEAKMMKDMELAGGSIIISNVTGTATIENNQLVEAGGKGEILVKPLNDMKGEFEVEWSNRGGTDQYSGSGWLDFTLIDRDPDTGRFMEGRIDAEYKSDNTFSASGDIDYAINDIIGGELTASVDQTWNPVLGGNINVDTDLVEARRLFGMEADLLPEQTIRLPYGLALFVGMKGGMGMTMDALHLNALIAVSDWKPLGDGSTVPTFDSTLDLNWGMNFEAMVAPYMGIGGDIGFASAQIGVRGEVVLDAPLTANATGKLHGDSRGFLGELAVGVGVAPTLDLDIVPYVKGQFGSLDPWESDLTRINIPLGTLFDFNWGRKYTFGDQNRSEDGPVERMDVAGGEQRETAREGRPSLNLPRGGSGGSRKGGPQIESGDQVAGSQEVGNAEGSMAGVMETLNDVIALIEGIGAMGELVSLVIGLITATATFGPAGFIVYLVWKIFKGELSWDGIKTAVDKVISAIQSAGRLLRKHMPDWWNSIMDVFTGERPGLLDALFGADDRMREAVGRGDHRHAPFDMHVEMVNQMKGGWLSSDDSDCIAQIFEVSASRGQLRRLVDACGGADEFIDGWSTGFNDERTKRVFRANGIDW